MTIHDSPFAHKLRAFVALSDEDLTVMSGYYKRRHVYAAGRDLVHQGEVDQPAYILASGWASSYKLLPDGGRQVIDFQIPGDFLGLRSVLFRTADYNVEPVTRIEASEIKRSDLFIGRLLR